MVQNSYPLIEKMDTIYSKKKAKEIWKFDLSTLHTNLPPQDIIRVFRKLVEFSFNGRRKDQNWRKKYLTVMKTVFLPERSVNLAAIPFSKQK